MVISQVVEDIYIQVNQEKLFSLKNGQQIKLFTTSPNTQWYAQSGTGGFYTKAGNPARWATYEVRDGVRIRVIYEPANGKIITAFPDSAPVPPNYKPISK